MFINKKFFTKNELLIALLNGFLEIRASLFWAMIQLFIFILSYLTSQSSTRSSQAKYFYYFQIFYTVIQIFYYFEININPWSFSRNPNRDNRNCISGTILY